MKAMKQKHWLSHGRAVTSLGKMFYFFLFTFSNIVFSFFFFFFLFEGYKRWDLHAWVDITSASSTKKQKYNLKIKILIFKTDLISAFGVCIWTAKILCSVRSPLVFYYDSFHAYTNTDTRISIKQDTSWEKYYVHYIQYIHMRSIKENICNTESYICFLYSTFRRLYGLYFFMVKTVKDE